jgi:hypothetical protein
VVSRRRLVRRLLVEGMGEGEIVRVLVAGVQAGGEVVRVSEATARRDLAAVAAEFRDLFDSDDSVELEIGAAWERYKGIAKAASSGPRPNFHAAISALDRVVKIAASRSPRWRHLAGSAASRTTTDTPGLIPEGDAELVARAQELAGLDDQELREHHRRLRERMNALGLTELPGGKDEGAA